MQGQWRVNPAYWSTVEYELTLPVDTFSTHYPIFFGVALDISSHCDNDNHSWQYMFWVTCYLVIHTHSKQQSILPITPRENQAYSAVEGVNSNQVIQVSISFILGRPKKATSFFTQILHISLLCTKSQQYSCIVQFIGFFQSQKVLLWKFSHFKHLNTGKNFKGMLQRKCYHEFICVHWYYQTQNYCLIDVRVLTVLLLSLKILEDP